MFKVSARTQNYVKKHGGHITVYTVEKVTSGCCDSSVITRCPAVRLGQPDEEEAKNFKAMEVEKITIWYSSDITPVYKNRPIEIDGERSLFAPYRFFIEGAKQYPRLLIVPRDEEGNPFFKQNKI